MVPVDFSKYAEDGLETAAINVLHILNYLTHLSLTQIMRIKIKSFFIGSLYKEIGIFFR
jgi:hypothetical protein